MHIACYFLPSPGLSSSSSKALLKGKHADFKQSDESCRLALGSLGMIGSIRDAPNSMVNVYMTMSMPIMTHIVYF